MKLLRNYSFFKGRSEGKMAKDLLKIVSEESLKHFGGKVD
jgi:hypothetical protein